MHTMRRVCTHVVSLLLALVLTGCHQPEPNVQPGSQVPVASKADDGKQRQLGESARETTPGCYVRAGEAASPGLSRTSEEARDRSGIGRDWPKNRQDALKQIERLEEFIDGLPEELKANPQNAAVTKSLASHFRARIVALENLPGNAPPAGPRVKPADFDGEWYVDAFAMFPDAFGPLPQDAERHFSVVVEGGKVVKAAWERRTTPLSVLNGEGEITYGTVGCAYRLGWVFDVYGYALSKLGSQAPEVWALFVEGVSDRVLFGNLMISGLEVPGETQPFSAAMIRR